MVSCNVPCLPGFGGWELFEVLQRGWHLEQLLVESQGEVEVHHCGVIDGQTADDPDQVEPVLLYKTLEMHAETLFSCCLSFTTSLWLKSEQSLVASCQLAQRNSTISHIPRTEKCYTVHQQ